jgi:hypothetical protein
MPNTGNHVRPNGHHISGYHTPELLKPTDDCTGRIKTNDELDKLIRHKNIINHIKAQRLS